MEGKEQNKDLNLKLLCKILFSKMGLNSHFEVRLRNKSYIASFKSHDISDIDVFAYKFNEDLSLYKVGSECKSGETNALDEFYKFLGISNYYKLNKAYLIKTKIHQNARQIAVANNFVMLTEAELRKMLLGFEIDVDKALKIEFARNSKRVKYLNDFKPKNEKLIEYINLDYWNRENWKNIHNILHILKQKNPQGAIFTEADMTVQTKYVYYYVAELFAYSILRAAEEAIILNYSDFESAFVSCLYGGAEALSEKRRIHDAVNIATKETKNFEPDFQSDLVSIATRWSQYTGAASKVPTLIQGVYENAFYEKEIKIDSRLLKSFPDLTRKFTADIMQFLWKHCDINPSSYEDFLNL